MIYSIINKIIVNNFIFNAINANKYLLKEMINECIQINNVLNKIFNAINAQKNIKENFNKSMIAFSIKILESKV